MIHFQVQDMSCNHCVGAISQALKAADPDAQVTIDLARHLVSVVPARADMPVLQSAIAKAGYTPVPVSPALAETAARTGGCCGGCR